MRTRTYRDFLEKIIQDDKTAAFEHKKMLLDQESIDNLANYICNMSWTFCYNMSKRPWMTVYVNEKMKESNQLKEYMLKTKRGNDNKEMIAEIRIVRRKAGNEEFQGSNG